MRSAALLAERQLKRDLRRTKAFPAIQARKLERMTTSPHDFLRGSSTLFYEMIRDRPHLGRGPAGHGPIVGDMHLENVGAYRTDGGGPVFDINDFDDAGVGEWRWDLLRLLTSVLLSARDFQAGSREVINLAELTVQGWWQAVFRRRHTPPPATVQQLIEPARRRTRTQVLDQRAPKGPDGRRRFVRGSRYLELPRPVQKQVPELFERYVKALGEAAPAAARTFKITDSALRVAGNGSLGRLRIAILVEASDHERIFELKEAAETPLSVLAKQSALKPSVRLVDAARRLVSRPWKHLAALPGGKFFGRRLMPNEDKLDLARLRPGPELDAVVGHVGALLGAAHARSSTRKVAPWSDAALRTVVDHAVELAGLHEAAFLAYGRICP